MQMMAKRFVTVKLIVRHRKVCIAHADIGAFDTPSTAVIAGAFRQIYRRYLGGTDPVAIDLGQREYGANRRLHLVALLRDLFLQVLSIVDADYLKSGGFIYAEQQHAAAVLVGEAGQRIIQSFRTIHMSRLAFDRLRLGFLFANSIC